MSHAVDLNDWHDLFLAWAGAGSALAGLIIVAMSANITTILTIPSMTSRAASTIANLTLVVIIACAGLVPHQPVPVFGAETTLASAVALALAVMSANRILRSPPGGANLGLRAGKAALGIVPTAGTLLGGLLLCADQEPGLSIVATAIITGLATSVTNAWVLLVEILR